MAIQTRLADGRPLVFGDRIQLQQVILNLMMNAIEAMSEVAENPRELLIASEKDEPSTVRIAVCDSGRGLSPESLSRMFSAFYTAEPQGIGMATFHFTLPGGGAA